MRQLKLHAVLVWAAALACSVVPLAAAADGLPNLRIMPLGDSITKGNGASDNTGYRKRLRDKVISYGSSSGVTIDMIGTQHDGSMTDNNHEGHSGKYLRDINEYYKLSIKARPNVVLVHAGTNNMDLEVDLDVAPSLMESILDGLFSNAPDVTVLVAPVIWADDARMQANTDAFNKKLAAIISNRQQRGQQILSVPISIVPGELNDKKHPNDKGYEKMASAWFSAILQANERGWLRSPVSVNANDLPGMGLGYGSGGSGGGDAGCDGGNWEKKGTVFNDFRVWDEVGTVMGHVENGSRDKLRLADLNNDGIADVLMADYDGTVRAWVNSGQPDQWKSLGKINPPWSSVTGDMVRMADVDNDGKADMIVVYSDGAAKVWKNVDNGKKFEPLDSNWATGFGLREKVYFQDMDGDGYADYVIVYSGGGVKWARNTRNNGKDSSKKNWEDLKTIAPGVDGIPADSVRLHDLDGDGLSDYLIVYNGGAVKALTNSGNLNSNSAERNWDDLGTIAPGVPGVTGDMVRFADLDGDSRADFLAVADDGSIRMWRNLGIVGSKSNSFRLTDLTGDGKADLISVDAKGRAQAWLNKGVGKWESIGEIAPGLNEDLSSARIVFADLNGDQRSDFIVIYADGIVKAYLNNGNIPDAGKGRIWQDALVISPGVGEPGRKIQFADLNGDSFADFLIIYDGGAVDAYLNNQNIPPKNGERIWQARHTIATGVGEEGSKVRFADLTGDGRDEYIVHYEGGAAIAFNNTGNIPEAGLPVNWQAMGTIAGGVSNQGPVRYADLDGDGKDDYLVVFAHGTIDAYINTCDWKQKDPPAEDPPEDDPPEDDPPEDDPDNDYEPPIDTDFFPECDATYKTLSQIEGSKNNIPGHCMEEYIVAAEVSILKEALIKYADLVDHDYDKKFKIYENYIIDLIPEQIDMFMGNGKAGDYFKCEETGIAPCCGDCRYFCDEDCDDSPDCQSGEGTFEIECPTVFKDGRDPLTPYDDLATVTFTLEHEDAFYKAIEKQYGIQKSWLKFESMEVEYHPGCKFAEDIKECEKEYGKWWYKYPAANYDKVEVINPKDLIGDSYKESKDLLHRIWAVEQNVNYGLDEWYDVVDSASLPALTMQSAVDSMDDVVELAGKIESEARQEMIANFLSAFLFFIPIVGSLAAAGSAALRTMFTLAGAAAETGLLVYDIVQDPENAFMAVFGALAGGGVSRGAFKKAANYRRSMSSGDVNKLGTVKKDLDRIDDLRFGSCKIR